jgi:hypothetical protein
MPRRYPGWLQKGGQRLSSADFCLSYSRIGAKELGAEFYSPGITKS